ncbi:MAG: hypothetical protein QGG09_15375, partial [Pirellulaceae bacterium]|nr:hypothetical protein [Pirellulaceae bacterium]
MAINRGLEFPEATPSLKGKSVFSRTWILNKAFIHQSLQYVTELAPVLSKDQRVVSRCDLGKFPEAWTEMLNLQESTIHRFERTSWQ